MTRRKRLPRAKRETRTAVVKLPVALFDAMMIVRYEDETFSDVNRRLLYAGLDTLKTPQKSAEKQST